MAKRKLGGLGKGLDSLFEDLPMTEDASPDLTRLPVREIEPDPGQPRRGSISILVSDSKLGAASSNRLSSPRPSPPLPFAIGLLSPSAVHLHIGQPHRLDRFRCSFSTAARA